MPDYVLEAVHDSLRMLPWLLAIYIGIELLEHRWGQAMRRRIQRAGWAGPLLGALFGCIPQCGFSVLTTVMYTQRLISPGTLLAVYLSTSDEAVPILLAHPERVSLVLPLLLTKVLVAVSVGYAVDLASRFFISRQAGNEVCAAGGLTHPGHTGCAACSPTTLDWRHYLLSPLRHTFQVFAFVLAVTLGLNWTIERIGAQSIAAFFLTRSAWQPVLTALIGLIPNCAASVVITELYLQGSLTYGATIAGLSAGAGLGLLVLVRENPSRPETIGLVGLLYGSSVAAGSLIQAMLG